MTTPFTVVRTKNRHSRAVISNDTIVIRLARNLSALEERLHVESLVRRMTAMLIRERTKTVIAPYRPSRAEMRRLRGEMYSRVQRINASALRVEISDVRLRAMRTQWGSCSSRGVITLNTALLKIPPHLLDYVIIHELAHRRVRSHSRAFWALVESACPWTDHARRELRQYRFY